MFGTNEIAGQKYFKDVEGTDKLFITSMFFTLQGEGPYSGRPALFVRLTKCNLACSFCDTFFDDGDWLSFAALEQKMYHTIANYWNDRDLPVPKWIMPSTVDDSFNIDELGPFNCVLVITGGEPLLQSNLMEFLKRQVPRFAAVQIESNGTVNQDVPEGVTLVCSPKCAEKNGVATKYLAPTKLILERADCLKFVMSADKDSPYNTIPEWAHEWKKQTGKEIYISPMNIYNDFPQKIKLLRSEKQGTITLEERSTVDEVISFWEKGLLNLPQNQLNHEYVAQYCMEHGCRMQMQVHLFASLA